MDDLRHVLRPSMEHKREVNHDLVYGGEKTIFSALSIVVPLLVGLGIFLFNLLF